MFFTASESAKGHWAIIRATIRPRWCGVRTHPGSRRNVNGGSGQELENQDSRRAPQGHLE